MKRMLLLLVGVVILSFSRSYADPVIDWNATAATVMSRVPTLARSFFVDLAYVHVAIYDAVNAIDRKHQVFAVDPLNAAPWASKEAAIAAAAHRVLVTFYPPQEAFLDSVYDAAIANLPLDSTTARGIAIGDTVASQYLALRVGDGREGVVTYSWQSVGVGVYQPTPPGTAQYQPVATWTAQMRPFVLGSAWQMRAPVPPAITSDVYTKDFIEVKAYGSRDTTSTMPAQREVARFHTENPSLFVTRNIREIARSESMSIANNARYFAQLYLTIADAQITGFNSKYYYNCWRPITAIRAAENDGNPLTEQDTSWMPLATTPLHPEYPAAHGFIMGAMTFGLQEFFDTPYLNIELKSNVTGTTHFFSTSNDLVAEVANARVWGGIYVQGTTI